MISVNEALSIVQAHALPFRVEKINTLNAEGRILAEDILADRDLPPYHRSAMDGIAVCRKDLQEGQNEFPIKGVIYAGTPIATLSPGTCLEIMTGATVPTGSDAVIRYEDVEITDQIAQVKTKNREIAPWANIHPQGKDARSGSRLIPKGKKISFGDISIMLSVGATEVTVRALPKVAVIATGDELVYPQHTPHPYQIRSSNIFTLQSILQSKRISVKTFHLQDQKQEMENVLGGILKEFDVVILSGGVSRGKKDFVPEVLESRGVQKLFHKVSQRPGKPLWFGAHEKAVVFGFPGNPVSTLVCFAVYFNSWLNTYLGINSIPPQAILSKNITFENPLTYFVPVKITNLQGMLVANPSLGNGSGDFVNLSDIDGFLELEQNRNIFSKDEVYNFYTF